MSGGYRVAGFVVLKENDVPVTSEELKTRFSCIFCEQLLRDAYQLTCGDRVCKSCMPSGQFKCPSCDEEVDHEAKTARCFADKYFQKDVLGLRVECQCLEKLGLDEWEIHKNNCPTLEVQASPEEKSLFSVDLSEELLSKLEGHLQDPVSVESYAPQSTLTRDREPPLSKEAEEVPQGPFKGNWVNVSVPLAGSIISTSYLKESRRTEHHARSEMVSNTSSYESSNTCQASQDIKRYIEADPVVLVIFNANDGSCGPLLHQPTEPQLHQQTDPQLHQQTEPQLSAQDSYEKLVPIFRNLGFCVVPVVNKSKPYLEALLDLLKQTRPKSVKLVMFVSTTHGKCDEICMNGENFKIPDIIQRLSKISCQSFFAIFDGCQVDGNSFSVKRVDKPYMAVYSAPPEYIAYHDDGIGIYMICLANALEDPTVSTLKDLVHHLNVNLELELSKRLKKPYPKDYKPVCVDNSSGTVDFRKMTADAMKPGLEFISRNDIMITLNIRCPKRVSYSNGKFELTSVIIVVGQQKLKKMTSQFEAIHSVTLELPPRAKTVTEYLKVVACYSDGREEASDGLEVLLPTYDVPQISSCSPNCQHEIKFIAKQEHRNSELYNVTSIEIGYMSQGEWECVHNGTEISPSDAEQTLIVALPHSQDPVAYDLLIRKYYEATSTYVDSDVVKLTQQSIPLPEIGGYRSTQCCQTKAVTFTINKCCDQYEISRCGVKYWINGTEHWAKGTSLSNNEVVVRIPFKATEVQALVDYEDLSEVKSVKYPTPHTCYDEKVNSLVTRFRKNKCRSCSMLWLLIRVLILSIFLGLLVHYFPSQKSVTDVLVSNYTIVHPFLQPTFWHSVIYKGVNVSFNPIASSDNLDMNVSVFTTNSMRTQNIAIKSNYTIHVNSDGRQCQCIPNEYSYPYYFVKGSLVTGTVSIILPSGYDTLHSAMLYGFKSRINLQDACNNIDKLSPMFSLNISSAVSRKDFRLQPYNVTQDTYIYFFVETIANSPVKVLLNLTLHFIYYLGLSDFPANSSEIVQSIWLGHNASIPFKLFTGVTYYVFAHDVGISPRKIAHFKFTRIPRVEVLTFAATILAGIIVYHLVALFCICCYKSRPLPKTLQSRVGINSQPNEHTHLLQHN